MSEPVYIDVDPETVVVRPARTSDLTASGALEQPFVGAKVGDNPDGSFRVLVCGVVADLRQAVFRKVSPADNSDNQRPAAICSAMPSLKPAPRLPH